MAYAWSDTIVGLPPVTDTDTTQKVRIGLKAKAFDPTYGEGEFIYLLGVASTVVGSVAIFDDRTGATTLTVAASRGPCAVAMSANVASQYGWYQIQGAAVVKAGTVAANTAAYSTATGGQIDDAVVAGSGIDGMTIKTADGTPAAGFAVAQISYPSMNSR
jgi:hypothetical protein